MSTTARLFLVALLVGLLAFSTYVFPELLKPKEVRLLDRKLAEMPLQFGSWRGAKVEVDPKILEWLLRDADDMVDRAYADQENNVVSVHLALFSKFDDGIRHSPFNCYRGAGWQKVDETQLMLPLEGNKSSIPVSLSTWELQGTRIMVMYWYQLDEHILFNRLDLAAVRWKMRNKEIWPAMIKVLLQTSAVDPDLGRERLQAIAQKTYGWLNRPVRQANSGSPAGEPPAVPRR